MEENNFIIFGQGRSGSNLLRALLNSNPQIFCDNEIFNPVFVAKKPLFDRLVIRFFPLMHVGKMRQHSGAKIYGFKLFTFHHKLSENIVEKLYNRGWKIIHIQRKNTLKQLFSRLIGLQSKVYVRRGNTPAPKETYLLDPQRVILALNRRNEQLESELRTLKNKECFTVVYEDDLRDKNRWNKTGERIFKFLGLDPVEVTSQISVTDPRADAERIENFDEIITYLNENGYSDIVEQYYNNL